MGRPTRIWVRVPNWVGDVLMATPALRALRRAHPEAELVVEGRAPLAPIVAGIPSVDGFLAAPPDGLGAAFRRGRGLRARGFDWAVLLPDSARVAWSAWFARVPVRAGYARDPLRRALLTLALDPPAEEGRRVPLPMPERYLRITDALGCARAGGELELEVDAAARDRSERRLAAAGVDAGEALLVVTPGASFGSSKLWPPEHFAAACDAIRDELGLLPVLSPGPGEEPIAAAVAEAMRGAVVSLVEPPLGLDELAALVARARLHLGNDTGPRQIAVALGTPSVVLMGPTDPRHSAHSLELQRVLREEVECSPCHLKTCPIDHRCMTRLAPQRAVAAAKELLA